MPVNINIGNSFAVGVQGKLLADFDISVNDSSVLSVGENGEISALKSGKGTVMVRRKTDGLTKRILVKVAEPPEVAAVRFRPTVNGKVYGVESIAKEVDPPAPPIGGGEGYGMGGYGMGPYGG